MKRKSRTEEAAAIRWPRLSLSSLIARQPNQKRSDPQPVSPTGLDA
jgi:hypothetical protein